ncbi:MAG TPA: phosphoenolpyruvate synthase [Candidatus Binatia bacterium]|nr:phosphoenolpyruvate synthase [Candidatus Binatia bacterium]
MAADETNTNLVMDIDSVSRSDVASVGGKAANLGELIKAHIPVPPGFIVPVKVFQQFIETTGLDSIIESQLAEQDTSDTLDLEARASQARETILSQPLPEAVVQAITIAYNQLIEETDGCVAVRSSATTEDLEEASFAGQQATYLNVLGVSNVLRAIQACWASLFETRAISYREHHGFDLLGGGVAVVVQQMVQSEIAGVMFSQNPLTGDPDQIEISAVWGLGEAVVSGEITPDSYIYSKSKRVLLERKLSPQTRQLVRKHSLESSLTSTNIWQAVSPDKVSVLKLSDPQVEKLVALANTVEVHYGQPQDMEWAYAAGEFYLTQSRPITVESTSYTLPDIELEPEPAEVLVSGQPASPGVGYGRVRILHSPEESHLVEPGDILVAEMTTPDYVPAMQRAAGIVTERGSRTSHAAIVSRELGVPCVVGAGSAVELLSPVDAVTVDGSHGQIFRGTAETRLAWNKQRLAVSPKSVETKTKVMVILAEPEKAEAVATRQVDGVGLLRAEFILARIGKHPRQFIKEGSGSDFVEQLAAGIESFCSAFNPRPVVYRLLDFKTNELAGLEGGAEFEVSEENPMLGFRGAARYGRDPEAFALELAAIKQVRSKFKNLIVMVPFVRTPKELETVIKLMADNGLERGPDFKLWMMAELPSNFLILDKFIDCGIDGISIGSNDLTQLILGLDRDNERLSGIGDERDPAVMKAFEMIVKTGLARGVTVGICGQAPSDFPEITQKLVEWGITSISVSPDMIEQTRLVIKACEA